MFEKGKSQGQLCAYFSAEGHLLTKTDVLSSLLQVFANSGWFNSRETRMKSTKSKVLKQKYDDDDYFPFKNIELRSQMLVQC